MSGMRLGMDISMRPELRQVLTPRMIQSMEILQMPAMALQEKIEHELEENPVLDMRDVPADASDPDAADGPAADAPPAEAEFNPDAPLKHDESGDIEFARMEELNRDWEDHFNEDHRPSRTGVEELSDKKLDAMRNVATAPQSLQDYLTEQLAYLDLTPDQHALAEFLIASLDENGYLLNHDPDRGTPIPVGLDELARTASTLVGHEVALADVEEALYVVQKLDPLGVGARDHKECLFLQVTDETPHRDLVRALVLHHLEDVAHNRLPVIQKKTGFDLETIKEAIDVLRRLDPRPGAKFAPVNTRYVTPDIVVDRTDDGDFDIRLTDDWTPRLRISKRYFDLYKDRSSAPEARAYLKQKIQSAQWLLSAIEQRRNTLIKVTRAIINHQRPFLDRGPEHIQPLKMEQIAEQVGVHVTTVSRAVDDKWVQTPRGVFPLKRFFGGGTRNAQTGLDVAWETIKQKLQEIIAGEDKGKPLSDEEIVERFKLAGLTVARRTVTKYREALNIPSSRQRKEWAK